MRVDTHNNDKSTQTYVDTAGKRKHVLRMRDDVNTRGRGVAQIVQLRQPCPPFLHTNNKRTASTQQIALAFFSSAAGRYR